MNNKIIFVVIALLVLVSSTVYLINSNSDGSVSDTNNNSSANEPIATVPVESTEMDDQETVDEIASTGQYIDYSEQSLVSNSNNKRILFFHAPWCSVCNFYEGQIEEQGVPDDGLVPEKDVPRSSRDVGHGVAAEAGRRQVRLASHVSGLCGGPFQPQGKGQ